MSIKIEPNLSQVTSHCPPVVNKIFNFLTGDKLSQNQLMGPLRDLTNCRQVSHAWRELGEPQQRTLAERVRVAFFPSIAEGPNLMARCGEFFHAVMQNMRNGVCAARVEPNAIIGQTFGESHVHNGNVFLTADRHFGANPEHFIMGDLQEHQIRKRFSADTQNFLWRFEVAEDGKLVAADARRSLIIWDSRGDSEQPLRTIETPIPFSRYCLTNQFAACVGEREIFFIDLETGNESGARIPIIDETANFGRIEATPSKLYFSRGGVIDVFDRGEAALERRIPLPDGRQFPTVILFNDELFLLASEQVYAVDPENFSVNPIGANDAIDGAPLGIPRWLNQSGGVMGHRQAHAAFLDKLAVTVYPHTRIYDLRTKSHIMTLRHEFAYYGYTAFADGKFHVAGWNTQNIGAGVFDHVHAVEIFDFNPPVGVPLLAPPGQEPSYLELFVRYVSRFFNWLSDLVCDCLGI